MNRKNFWIVIVISVLIVFGSNKVATARPPSEVGDAILLVTGLQGGSGSTVGPDGALYVTEGAAGRISRVDPKSGVITTYASGLPVQLIPLGGVIDVAFVDGTAYALVTLVGSDLGGSNVVGIYRVDGPTTFTVVADIGAFSILNPPSTDFFVPSGLQYAMETYRGGFLVTDGHHNRVLRVTLDGQVSEMMAFPNIVPTGLEVRGKTVYMAEAGPNPHLPDAGKVIAFAPYSPGVREVASGAPLLVDVEFGPGNQLYALAQGEFLPGSGDGSPAQPNTGLLVQVNKNGTFSVVTDQLDRPTSLEFIGNTGYVVTLTGEIWKIEGILP